MLEKDFTATPDRHMQEWGSQGSPWTGYARRTWDALCEGPKSCASMQHFRCASLLQRVSDLYGDQEMKKVLTFVQCKSNTMWLISSSPCSNVRLAKHLGFPGLRTVTLGKHSSTLARVLALPFNLWPSTLSHFAAANNVPSVQGKSLPALHTWVPKALLPPETHLARPFCPRRS